MLSLIWLQSVPSKPVAGDGKVLQGRSRKLLGIKGFTPAYNFHSELKGNNLILEIRLILEVNAWLGSQIQLIPLPPQAYERLEKPVE